MYIMYIIYNLFKDTLGNFKRCLVLETWDNSILICLGIKAIALIQNSRKDNDKVGGAVDSVSNGAGSLLNQVFFGVLVDIDGRLGHLDVDVSNLGTVDLGGAEIDFVGKRLWGRGLFRNGNNELGNVGKRGSVEVGVWLVLGRGGFSGDAAEPGNVEKPFGEDSGAD